VILSEETFRETCQLSRQAGIPWPHNGLRHSYISYRLALINDVAKVALEAGNSPAMIFRHYRELVTEDAAKAWFSIAPPEGWVPPLPEKKRTGRPRRSK